MGKAKKSKPHKVNPTGLLSLKDMDTEDNTDGPIESIVVSYARVSFAKFQIPPINQNIILVTIVKSIERRENVRTTGIVAFVPKRA
jgi:hypothetical protein